MNKCDICDIMNCIIERIKARSPKLKLNRDVIDQYQCDMLGSHRLVISLPRNCVYLSISIICSDFIAINVDFGNGPHIVCEYDDPNCIDTIFNFIDFITSYHCEVKDLDNQLFALLSSIFALMTTAIIWAVATSI